MKTSLLFLLILCNIALVPGKSAAQENPFSVISLNDAVITAENHIARFANSDFNLKAHYLITATDQSTPLMWVFEVSPQGYIIVPASHLLSRVIAYSFQNNFGVPDAGNPLFRMLRADVENRMQYYSTHGFIQVPPTSPVSVKQGNQSETGSRPFDQWPATGDGWLKTNWTQNSPYNDLCPMDPVTLIRSYAGCPSVAMAQILNFHMNTNNTHFDDSDDYYHNYAGRQYWIDDDYLETDFASFPQLNENLDSLNSHWSHSVLLTGTDKAALTFACGVACKQVYSSEGSGTFGVDQALTAYLRFGFTTVNLLHDSDPDLWERLKQNIKDTLPAHLAVVDPSWQSGHNVVVDGYNSEDYYHINFGWGGAYNGWYLLPEEMPYGLTVVEGIVLDIMKDSTVSTLNHPMEICRVFPNPSNSVTTISFDNPGNTKHSITVYNTSGQLIESIEHITGNEVSLSNHNRQPGMYFFRLKNTRGEYSSGKFSLIK